MTEFKRNLAVVIGIDHYQNGIQPLRTAAADAQKIADILRSQHQYQLIHLDCASKSPILNETATLQNLRQLFAEVLPNQVRPSQHDRLLIYFAGHGITRHISEKGPQGFLIPQDADVKNPDSLLPMQELYENLNRLECRHLLLILDCCFAGMFRWANTRKVIAIPETIHWEHYHRFIKYPAWQVITSAAHNQTALDYVDNRGEGQSENHSPFAKALFSGLQDGKADLIRDGVITTPELYLYLREYVEKLSNEQQTPGYWPLGKHDRGEYIFQLVPEDQLQLKPAPKLEKDNNPYRGLESFEERHARFFFGRNEVIEALASHISKSDQQFTVVDGISGSGKSSLVKAGLLPYLKQQQSGAWKFLKVLSPGSDPYFSLAGVLQLSHANPAEIKKNAQHLENTPSALQQFITRLSQQYPHRRFLLIIDQFEELITLEPVRQISTAENRLGLLGWLKRKKGRSLSPAKKSNHGALSDEQYVSRWQSFVETLETTLKACPQLHILVTLRSDFSSRFQDSALSERWAGSRFVVRPMRSDELREVVVGPANEMALYFEPSSLVDRLVDEVAQTPGALPLLSFTLSELYLKLYDAWHTKGKENRALSIDADFDKRGGVAGLLALRANEEYAKLPNEAHRQTMQRVMLRMVELESIEATKRRVPKSELVYTEEAENKRVNTVLSRLDQARLTVGGDDAGVAYVELVHDFLVRGWDMLQSWIREEQETLALQRVLIPAAKNWHERNTDLWNGNSRLDTLKQIKNSGNSWFNKIETDFVRKSLLRKRRNVQLRGLVFIGLLAGSLATTAVVNAARQSAETSRQEAVRQRDIAVERELEVKRRNVVTLVTNAEASLELEHFSDALLSAVQAGAIVKDEPRLYSDQIIKVLVTTTLYSAYYGLGKSVNRSEQYDIVGEPSDMAVQAYYALPGELASISTEAGMAASTENRQVTIWEIASGTPLLEKQLEYQPAQVILLPTQSRFATVSTTNGTVSIDFWAIETGEVVSRESILPTLGDDDLAAMNPTVLESLLLSVDAGLDIAKLTAAVSIEELSRFSNFALSPNLEWLAGYSESSIVLLNVESGSEIQLAAMPDSMVDTGDVNSSDDGAQSSGLDEDVPPHSVGAQDDIAEDIVFGPNGDTVVAVSGINEVRTWFGDTFDAVGGINEVRTWSLSGELLNTAQFDADLCNTTPAFGVSAHPIILRNTTHLSPDGTTLAVACGNGIVKIWDVNKANTVPLAIKMFDGTGGNTNMPTAFSAITFDHHLPIIGIENVLNGQTLTQFIRLKPEREIQPVVIDRVIYDFAFSPDDSLATVDQEGYVSLWDSSGNELQKFLIFENAHNFFLGHFGGIGDGGPLGLDSNRPRIAVDASGELLAISSGSVVKVINRSGDVLHDFTNSESVTNLGFTNERSLLLIGESSAIAVFDTQSTIQSNSPQPFAEDWLAESYSTVYASAISPDGKWIAIAAGGEPDRDSFSVQLLNIADQTSYELLTGDRASNVRELLFDTESSYLSIGKSRDARVQLWDVQKQALAKREIKVNTRALVSSSIHASKEMFAVTTGQATPGKTLSIGTQLVTFDGTVLLELSQLELEKVLFNHDSSLFGALRLKNDGRGTRFDGLLLWDFTLETLLFKSCEQLETYLNSPLLSQTERSSCDLVGDGSLAGDTLNR